MENFVNHMVEEIQANLKEQDSIKAILVLDQLLNADLKIQNRVLFEISKTEPSFSIYILNEALARNPKLSESLPKVREMLFSLLISYPESFLETLKRSDVTDKSILMQVAGEIKFDPATPTLLQLVSDTLDNNQIKQVIVCLGEIGDARAISTLTDYLYSTDHSLILTAIEALGSLETAEAMESLAERMGTDSEIDLLILKIFSRVQDQVSIRTLNKSLASHYAFMRTFAKSALVKIGPKSVPVLLENLHSNNEDLLIHTLNVLGDIRDGSAIEPVRSLLQHEPDNANVRFAAYEALGLLPLKKGVYTLTSGLTDPDEHVCIAAAKAINGNFSEILAAGIKNLIRANNDDSKNIVKIIVTTLVDKIFLSLATEDYFQDAALPHLKKAHKDIRNHYVNLLKRNGQEEFSAKIESTEEVGAQVSMRLKVCAVDDSRMILNIYKATLHELGFEPVLFEFPAGALKWIQKEKPEIVLTDLNMPNITGVQFTEEIRKIYSGTQLPVIMVTTQGDAQDHDAALNAGVNAIMLKPFNAKSLKAAMGEFIAV